jgi:hypothetical protein
VVKLVVQLLASLPDDPDAFVFPGRQKHTAHRQQSYHGFRRRFIHAVNAAGLGDSHRTISEPLMPPGLPTRTVSWSLRIGWVMPTPA